MGIREELGFRPSGTIRAYSAAGRNRPKPQREPSRKEGHDALIESLRHKDTWINIVTLNGETFSGRLNQSDRFTVSFTPEDYEVPVIFFKHAIESFTLTVRE